MQVGQGGDTPDVDSNGNLVLVASLGSGGTAHTLGVSSGLSQDVTFQLTGSLGSQVFSFKAGDTAATIKAAVNQATSQTGVAATDTLGSPIAADDTLTFVSQDASGNAIVGSKRPCAGQSG